MCSTNKLRKCNVRKFNVRNSDVRNFNVRTKWLLEIFLIIRIHVAQHTYVELPNWP